MEIRALYNMRYSNMQDKFVELDNMLVKTDCRELM